MGSGGVYSTSPTALRASPSWVNAHVAYEAAWISDTTMPSGG
jgi:hypothetical protein